MTIKSTIKITSVICLLFLSINVFAIQRGKDDVLVRVIDSGVGLCCLIVMPGNPDPHYIIYDAGDYQEYGKVAFEKIKELVVPDSEIELMVLSHSDSDHLGAVGKICTAYQVKQFLRSGYPRKTNTWRIASGAIEYEQKTQHDLGSKCIDIDLDLSKCPMGTTYKFDDVYFTMVCGFHKPPKNWGSLNDSKQKNAGSIVMRLQYNGKSILFCGDAVGRNEKIEDPNQIIATEKFMVDNSHIIPIDSDVIIAPHHGADNASSKRFIKAVSPEYVIFSAGNKHQHPRANTAGRYITCGVEKSNMFRTDLGDDERKPDQEDKEWAHGRQQGHKDKSGDDDIDILIEANGNIRVEYLNPDTQAYHIEINT